MTEWQWFCLAQMGIERWERRSVPAAPGEATIKSDSSLQSVQSLYVPPPSMAASRSEPPLIAASPGAAGPIPFRLGIVLKEPLRKETKQLLLAVLAAIDCADPLISISKIPTVCSALWLMTEKSVDVRVPCVQSVPLSKLLAEPLQKRALFLELQDLVARASP